MRILAILAICISATFAVEGSITDLPEDVQADTQKMIVSQMKILEQAHQDLEKLRLRFIKSLKSDLKKAERKKDEAAIAAIKVLIQAQEEMLSIVDVGGAVVDSGLPVDPSEPQDIFDIRTVEERKADFAAQKAWSEVTLGGSFVMKISPDLVDLMDKSEYNSVSRWGAIEPRTPASFLKNQKTSVIDMEIVFKSLYPKSYENGVRPRKMLTYALKVNGKRLSEVNQINFDSPFDILSIRQSGL